MSAREANVKPVELTLEARDVLAKHAEAAAAMAQARAELEISRAALIRNPAVPRAMVVPLW